MSERLSRKEIKHDIREDAIALFINRVFDWIGKNTRTLVAGGIGLVAAVVIAIIAGAVAANQREAAADALADAVKTFKRPVADPSAEASPATETDPADPPADEAETFASDEERRAAAREQFEAVHSKLAGGAASDVAGLFLADIAVDSGETEKAEELWRTFADDHKGHMLAIIARLNLISLARQRGEAEALVEELRTELERGRASLPEDILLYELATTLEDLGRAEEARTYYQQIVDEHASSPYAADARTRAAASQAA